MPLVALARLYAPLLGLFLPLILAGSWAGADAAATKVAEPVLIISQRDCRQLADHYLTAGISSLFDEDEQETRAAAASPATLGLAKLEEVAIDVTGDLQKRLGLAADSVLVQSEAGVGNAVVRWDGSAAVNGRILGDNDGYALAVLCRMHGQANP